MPLSIQLMSMLLRRELIADGSILPSQEQPRSSCHGTVFAFFSHHIVLVSPSRI